MTEQSPARRSRWAGRGDAVLANRPGAADWSVATLRNLHRSMPGRSRQVVSAQPCAERLVPPVPAGESSEGHAEFLWRRAEQAGHADQVGVLRRGGYRWRETQALSSLFLKGAAGVWEARRAAGVSG